MLRRHLANAPWTKPSVASILTGLHPSAHGARYGYHRHTANRRVEALSDRLVSLPEVLQRRGYATAAWMTNAHLRAEWGFNQGYDTYAFRRRPVRRGEMPEVDRRGVDFAIERLRGTIEATPTGPVFVWLHLMAVHQYESDADPRPFTAGDPTPIDREARRAWRVLHYDDLGSVTAAYDNAIHAADAEIGRLWEVIRREVPNTALLITSDHGEELYDHGGFEHGATLYNELLWVPGVLWGPGVPAGGEITGLTDSLDLFPTLLRLAGGEGEDPDDTARPGHDLLAAHAGRSVSFAERHAQGRHIGYSLSSEDGYKLIVAANRRTGRTVRREVYADGHRVEGKPLPPDEAADPARELGRRLTALRAEAETIHAAVVGKTPTHEADAEDLERLRSLGYVQ